jgi:hypothetical protein
MKDIGLAAFGWIESLTVTYQGTIEEWMAIEKDDHWNFETGNYTVHCTDGDIEKE